MPINTWPQVTVRGTSHTNLIDPFAPHGPNVYSLGDLKLNAYQVLIRDPHADQGYDLTPLCTSLQWDYDLDQACEKFTVTFVKVTGIATLLRPLNHLIITGIKVNINGVSTEYQPLKFGVIIDTELTDAARGTLTVTAYDIMWYLANNKTSHILNAETATSFITRIAALYGIKMGATAETGIQIGPDIFPERTIWDMFVTTLSLTRDIAYSNRVIAAGSDPSLEDPVNPEDKGDRYYIRTNFDKVMLLRKQDPQKAWKFETGNIFAASNRWSAQNYRNVVRVYARSSFDTSSDGVDQMLATAGSGDITVYGQYPEDPINDPDVLKYGMLSEGVSLAGASDPNLMEADNTAQAQYQAKELWVRLHRILQTGTITTVNINTLGPGDPVYINEPITGLVAKYYVKSGQHKVTAQSSTMNLTLNAIDALPEAYKSKAESVSSLFGPVV